MCSFLEVLAVHFIAMISGEEHYAIRKNFKQKGGFHPPIKYCCTHSTEDYKRGKANGLYLHSLMDYEKKRFLRIGIKRLCRKNQWAQVTLLFK